MNAGHAFTADVAAKFARLALAHVSREYPNKLDHVLTGDGDVQGPRALHPIFHGSFDWHSCVHGYWLLARVYRRFPSLPECVPIRALFNSRFTEGYVATEAAYAAHPARAGFERPYGWAWLLMLAAELSQHEGSDGLLWRTRLAPLASVFARRFTEFLPKATYPVRVGTHFNTAFAVLLALEYARSIHDEALTQVLHAAARRWYDNDRGAQAWEPGGDDFLSSVLIEAQCMQAVLPSDQFSTWMDRFLPHIATGEPATLFTPAIVSDRSDGKIAHLDGLNLSRAWCWRSLARAWSTGDPRQKAALTSANVHLDASLPHVAGDYMGEHWLATYALLALDGLS